MLAIRHNWLLALSLLFGLGFIMLLDLVVNGADSGDDKDNEPKEPSTKHRVVKCAVLE